MLPGRAARTGNSGSCSCLFAEATTLHLPDPEPALDKGSPSASRANRFPEDQLLRRHDFRIWGRPRRGPVRWQHCYSHEILTHAEAVAFVRKLLAELEAKAG